MQLKSIYEDAKLKKKKVNAELLNTNHSKTTVFVIKSKITGMQKTRKYDFQEKSVNRKQPRDNSSREEIIIYEMKKYSRWN